MDPQACLARFLSALNEKDYEEAKESQEDLKDWLSHGGFPPNWEGISKRDFFFWTVPS
jgi:hypothetical protein